MISGRRDKRQRGLYTYLYIYVAPLLPCKALIAWLLPKVHKIICVPFFCRTFLSIANYELTKWDTN